MAVFFMLIRLGCYSDLNPLIQNAIQAKAVLQLDVKSRLE